MNYSKQWILAAIICLSMATTLVRANGGVCSNDTDCGQGRCTNDSCLCPLSTGGDYCCTVINDTTGEVCGGDNAGGACATGGACECPLGFGGPWCCPFPDTEANATTTDQNPCGDHGCCMYTGLCECDNGWTGATCQVQIAVAIARVSGLTLGLGLAGGAVAVGALVAYFATAPSLAAELGATGSGALAGVTVGGRARPSRRRAPTMADRPNRGAYRSVVND